MSKEKMESMIELLEASVAKTDRRKSLRRRLADQAVTGNRNIQAGRDINIHYQDKQSKQRTATDTISLSQLAILEQKMKELNAVLYKFTGNSKSSALIKVTVYRQFGITHISDLKAVDYDEVENYINEQIADLTERMVFTKPKKKPISKIFKSLFQS